MVIFDFLNYGYDRYNRKYYRRIYRMQMIEFGGLSYADSYCTLCSPGEYNSEVCH